VSGSTGHKKSAGADGWGGVGLCVCVWAERERERKEKFIRRDSFDNGQSCKIEVLSVRARMHSCVLWFFSLQ
jgi:hypothetical protein